MKVIKGYKTHLGNESVIDTLDQWEVTELETDIEYIEDCPEDLESLEILKPGRLVLIKGSSYDLAA